MPITVTTSKPILINSGTVHSIAAGAQIELNEIDGAVKVRIYGTAIQSAEQLNSNDGKEIRVSYTVRGDLNGNQVHSNSEIRIGQQLFTPNDRGGRWLVDTINMIDHALYYESGVPEYAQVMDKLFVDSPDVVDPSSSVASSPVTVPAGASSVNAGSV